VLRLGEDGTCDDVRIGLGAAGPIPLRARRTEAALRGSRLSRASIEEAAALVREEVDPLDDLRGSASYKREMARVWTERALLKLAGLGDEVAAR
jgi:carbon-monoxide dehydrogenase medium subunit